MVSKVSKNRLDVFFYGARREDNYWTVHWNGLSEFHFKLPWHRWKPWIRTGSCESEGHFSSCNRMNCGRKPYDNHMKSVLQQLGQVDGSSATAFAFWVPWHCHPLLLSPPRRRMKKLWISWAKWSPMSISAPIGMGEANKSIKTLGMLTGLSVGPDTSRAGWIEIIVSKRTTRKMTCHWLICFYNIIALCSTNNCSISPGWGLSSPILWSTLQ